MYWPVLIIGFVCVTFGVAHGSDSDHAQASLVVTTHNPGCTAVFLAGYGDSVVRQTELQPYNLYRNDALRDGINMTFIVQADKAPNLVSSLVDRLEVSGAVLYSNSTSTGSLVPGNMPNAYKYAYGRVPCTELSDMLLKDAVNALWVADLKTTTGRNSTLYTDLVFVSIDTTSITKTSTYLQENGAVINLVYEHEKEGGTIRHCIIEVHDVCLLAPEHEDMGGVIEASIPVRLLLSLLEEDHITQVTKSGKYVPDDNYVDTDTYGHVDANIRVGLVDTGFGEFNITDSAANVSFYCFGYDHHTETYQSSQTDASLCYGDTKRDMAVETLMKMVMPGTEMYLSRVSNHLQLADAISWMADNGVDVISMPRLMPYEDTDGNTYTGRMLALDAINQITKNNITWIDVSGNYTGGKSWSAMEPQTYNGLIVFDSGTNDIKNQLKTDAGELVTVWLHWHDKDNHNTDLNLYVDNGTHYHISRADQLNESSAVQAESVAFVPSNDNNWNISIGVMGTAIPDWIQLFVDGINHPLEYHTVEGAVPGAIFEYDSSDAQASLVITTHNPACTAIFLSGYDVARQMAIHHDNLYPIVDLQNGVNITYIIHADDTYKLVSELGDRQEVSSVASYSIDTSPRLLAQDTNPNVYMLYPGISPCFEVQSSQMIYNAVGSMRDVDLGPVRASDSVLYPGLIIAHIDTSNFSETRKYLKENGASIGLTFLYQDGSGAIEAYIPVHIMSSLQGLDHITMVDDPGEMITTSNDDLLMTP